MRVFLVGGRFDSKASFDIRYRISVDKMLSLIDVSITAVLKKRLLPIGVATVELIPNTCLRQSFNRLQNSVGSKQCTRQT